MNKKWKDYFLKSGIPLEYSVQKFLEEKKFWVEHEISYQRKAESGLIKEFSYDLKASFRNEEEAFFKNAEDYSTLFNLLIECKYRDQSTNWIFTPKKDSFFYDIRPSSLFHCEDLFTSHTHFFLSDILEEKFALCGNGVEITSNGQNPKTITQAVKQLSYAFGSTILDGIEDRYRYMEFGDTLKFYIPIIITTANLLKLNEDVELEDIYEAKEIEDIATKEEAILLQHSVGTDLKKYNQKKVEEFESRIGNTKITEKFSKEIKDFNFEMNQLVINSPQVILILKYKCRFI